LGGYRSVSDERSAGAADVIAVYQIALGRNPESDAAIETYAGTSLGDVISRVLLSDEMAQLVANAMENGVLPHPRCLAVSDFSHASNWLSVEIEDFTLEGAASWWLLIDQFTNELWQTRLGHEVGPPLADYATFVAARADDAKSIIARMRSSMMFDPEWYLRAHARSIATFSSGAAISSTEHFLSAGRLRGDQLLAAFGDDMQPIYRRVPNERRSSMGAHLEAILEAAGRGETAHWLFDAEFCRKSRARRERDGLHVTGSAVSYLQFLLDGDREEWAPHPLFCHYAYRQLNAPSAGCTAFEDYLIRGMFEGGRTSGLFDPDYYLALNSNARLALLRGTHHDALHHFLTVGIYLDLGFSPDFDADFYREIYPDVSDSIRTGDVPSASWHFLHRGLLEGRRPNPFFDPHYYTQRHPHISAEMAHMGILSPLEHFLLVGRARGLKAESPLAERRPSLDEAKIVFSRRALRSFDRQWRTPLDFRPFVTKSPILSVIVPVSNEAPFTALFLECAYFAAAHMFHAGVGGVEIIIVDNGSTDQTSRLVERSKGLKSLHFAEPLGYPLAIQAGAGAALGKIVIVANNDVSFQPDTFGFVVSKLEADDSIGVLGPLVILPNETLQEAGSFVDRSGGIVNLGRFENPWDAYFRSVIEADYCGGCFFGFRLEDFVQVGGIDEIFSPGYYEEADFNFRMRERLGKRAVVLPDLQVVHFEHASFGKGRPPSSAFAAIQRNRTLFAEKHSEALLDRPTPSALAPGGYASRTVIARRRMLVIVDSIPHRGGVDNDSGTIHILRGLESAGLAFELLVLHPDPDIDEFEDPRVTVNRDWMPGVSAEAVLADTGRRFSHVLVVGLPQLSRFAPLLEPIRQATGLRIICAPDCLEAPVLLGNPTLSQTLNAVRLELGTSTLVSAWITANRRDRGLIKTAGLGAAISIAMTPNLDDSSRPGLPGREGVLLLGGARSCAAAAWLAGQIRAAGSPEPDDVTPILISGGWQTRLALQADRDLPDMELEIIDAKDRLSLRAAHDRCHVAVAPPCLCSLAEALQAMAFDVPVIMSQQLASALHADGAIPEGLATVMADDGDTSYGWWLNRLAGDPELWTSVQQAQRAMLVERRLIDDFAAGMSRLIEML